MSWEVLHLEKRCFHIPPIAGNGEFLAFYSHVAIPRVILPDVPNPQDYLTITGAGVIAHLGGLTADPHPLGA